MTHNNKIINSANKKEYFNNKLKRNINITNSKVYLFKSYDTNNFNQYINKDIDKNYYKNEEFFKKYLSITLDEMDYFEALKYDSRKFCEYFKETLEQNQNISNTFIAEDIFKPRSIKIILFGLNIILYFVINGLFFNEDYISKIFYLEEDKFFDFIPRMIDRFFYCTFVGIIIEFIVDFFFVDEKKIKGIFLREKNNYNKLKYEIIELINLINKRYRSFIIFVIIILFLCLYDLLCFNYVYPHMQIEWIKSSIAIILIRQFLSFLACLFETIFRFMSFKCESEKMFKLSKLIN